MNCEKAVILRGIIIRRIMIPRCSGSPRKFRRQHGDENKKPRSFGWGVSFEKELSMFVKNENIITLVRGTAFTARIAPGNFMLRYAEQTGYYLEESPNHDMLPKKLFGAEEIDRDATRWLSTFDRTTKNIGVLLHGIRGSGKTITAQYLCQKAGRPVIHIVEKIPESLRESFLTFMASEELYGSLVMIDEFEKIFGSQGRGEYSVKQDEVSILPMLQLMDGMFPTHLMFILTTNGNISEHFENRLGRIRYRKNYDTLPESIVSDVIDLTMKDGKDKDQIKEVIDRIGVITYDMLHHIVDEINHSDDDIRSCLCRLNITPVDKYYRIFVKYTGPVTQGVLDASDSSNELWAECYGKEINLFFDEEIAIQLYTQRFRGSIGWDETHADDKQQIKKWLDKYDHCDLLLGECQITEGEKGVVVLRHSLKDVTVKIRPVHQSDFVDPGRIFDVCRQENKAG